MGSFTPNQNPNKPRRYDLFRRTTKDRDSLPAFNSLSREEAQEALRKAYAKPKRTVIRIDFDRTESDDIASYIYSIPVADPEAAYRSALESFDKLKTSWPESITLRKIIVESTNAN